MSTLRIGIVGAGMIASVHARAALLNGARIAGVTASTPERSREAARRLGAERAFDSAEELIASAGIDIVHLCTPNHLHAPLATAALRAGKHVVCEKPLAMDVTQAEALAGEARASGLVTAVPFVYRYYALVRQARARLRGGGPGDLRLIHGGYLQDWLLDEGDDNWRVDAALGGASRAFGDIGSHWCDLAQFVSGHVITSLTARTLQAHAERRRTPGRTSFSQQAPTGGLVPVDTEDAVAVQFTTDRGALGSLMVSQISAGHKNRLHIEFDAAAESLAFDQERPETLWCGRRDGVELRVRDPARLPADARRVSSLPAGHPEGYERCFEAFLGDVYTGVRTGTVPATMPTFDDGLAAARLTDAVLRSAATGAWTDVPPTI
ncbi:Gfo/Idh/MocA family protein [Actinomadura macrotermitis]|uniref:Inositol 2-dehydrogenase/D-chiro-inositol 3-dehydrogenase n=1 Tax=Actinomadura macrotermitis TaxID=2585200 RepID=A0A7K0BLM4_9ACTN|nr:Gfo/Idh/MocA family oxidoreductase [Actinomadura macrotermitis]MQY02085.1 Inositol 2-dehydrogenase/D-chiro-inositol 3-dehydrogenase [Actinomadura macrotermitis]